MADFSNTVGVNVVMVMIVVKMDVNVAMVMIVVKMGVTIISMGVIMPAVTAMRVSAVANLFVAA